jgi:hypothetical protein
MLIPKTKLIAQVSSYPQSPPGYFWLDHLVGCLSGLGFPVVFSLWSKNSRLIFYLNSKEKTKVCVCRQNIVLTPLLFILCIIVLLTDVSSVHQ